MKKIASVILRILPILFFIPFTGVSLFAYESCLMIYLCYLLCIVEAGKDKVLFIEETTWVFIFFAVAMFIVRMLSLFSIPGPYHLDEFYKNSESRIYFIVFSVIAVLMMISFQIFLIRSGKDNLAGKICGFIGVLVFEFFILYFLIHSICNSDFFNQFLLLEEMFFKGVF